MIVTHHVQSYSTPFSYAQLYTAAKQTDILFTESKMVYTLHFKIYTDVAWCVQNSRNDLPHSCCNWYHNECYKRSEISQPIGLQRSHSLMEAEVVWNIQSQGASDAGHLC